MHLNKLTIENCLSINSAVTIDFQNEPVACFVGFNGSGKTNIIVLLQEMVASFLNVEQEERVLSPSFDGSLRDSRKELEFTIDEVVYTYSIHHNSKRGCIKEELRDNKNGLVLDMNLKSDVGKLNKSEKERFETYNLPEIGIFSLICNKKIVLADRKLEHDILNVKNFFEQIIFVGNYPENFDVAKILYENLKVKEKVINFMNYLDCEIEGIEVEKIIAEKPNDISKTSIEKVNDRAKAIAFLLEFLQTETETYRIQSIRKKYLSEALSYSLESRGTKRLLTILTWAYFYMNNVIVIDEIEIEFHEILVLELIKELQRNSSQLIFTTHLLELMTKNLINKHQLYSVFKRNGETNVFHLEDLVGYREDRHSLKSLYRTGKFPGYPVVNEK